MRLGLVGALCTFIVGGCSSDSDPGTPSGGVTEPDTCPTSTGAGTTVTSALTSDTTWTAEGSPYVLESGVAVPTGVTLTLAPCTVVQLGAAASVTLSGRLVAKGEAGKRVRIEALDAAKPWAWIDASAKTALDLDLAYTTVSGGGATSTGSAGGYAAIRVRGAPNDAPIASLIRVDHVLVENSASVGIQLVEGAGFSADSTDLTITGSALHPLVVEGLGLGAVPTGSYTGNGNDVIDVDSWQDRLANGSLASDVVMHSRGVPYRIGSDVHGGTSLTIGDDGTGATARTTLTLEAGVTVRMRKAGVLTLQGDGRQKPTNGSLVAVGTASAPITFTSDAAVPAAGDWKGLWLEGGAPDNLKIENAVIEYAGLAAETRGYSCGVPDAASADIANRGALVIASETPITASFVTATTFKDSASNGVDRGWSGAAVDFAAGNRFVGIASCTQTENKDAGGTCPAEPSCPKAD